MDLGHTNAFMEEVCDNGVDDDMDGLIDLLDPDCQCPLSTPSSLIPNPSFEELQCCPDEPSQLHCAEGWIQASEATTDLLNSCGFIEVELLQKTVTVIAPRPFPDGQTVVGFLNGVVSNPQWKEYTGACLSEHLKVGVKYMLQFHLGFADSKRSPPLNMALFGTGNCAYLPFGKFNKEHGCPLNGKGWQLIDTVTVNGENNWVQQSFTFTPTEEIHAIALGPECKSDPYGSYDHYYFLDNLILAEVHEFETNITSENEPCSPDFRLLVQESDTVSYQWYLDGVAIIGSNKPVLQGPLATGVYQVRLQGVRSCKVSPEFPFSRPESRSTVEVLVCDQSSYDFNGTILPVPGFYTDTLKTKDGCDSIVDISLLESQSTTNQVTAKIFPGETFKIGRHTLSTPLRDSFYLTTSSGCDSLVVLDLSFFQVYIPNAFTPNGDGNNDIFNIYGDDDLIEIETLRIFDRWGNIIFHKTDLDPHLKNSGWDGTSLSGELLNPGVFIFTTLLRMSDQKSHQLNGSVVLIR